MVFGDLAAIPWDILPLGIPPSPVEDKGNLIKHVLLKPCMNKYIQKSCYIPFSCLIFGRHNQTQMKTRGHNVAGTTWTNMARYATFSILIYTNYMIRNNYLFKTHKQFLTFSKLVRARYCRREDHKTSSWVVEHFSCHRH
jgi:hypothetical protein